MEAGSQSPRTVDPLTAARPPSPELSSTTASPPKPSPTALAKLSEISLPALDESSQEALASPEKHAQILLDFSQSAPVTAQNAPPSGAGPHFTGSHIPGLLNYKKPLSFDEQPATNYTQDEESDYEWKGILSSKRTPTTVPMVSQPSRPPLSAQSFKSQANAFMSHASIASTPSIPRAPMSHFSLAQPQGNKGASAPIPFNRPSLGPTPPLTPNQGAPQMPPETPPQGMPQGLLAGRQPPGTIMSQSPSKPPAKVIVPKSPPFDYRHADTDTTMAELEEYFSYVEIPELVSEGRESWETGWENTSDKDWTEADLPQKKTFLLTLLEQLEHQDYNVRFQATRRLGYVAQGCPMYATSPEHQLHLIITNCALLRDIGALHVVYDALKSVGGRWSFLTSSFDADNPLTSSTSFSNYHLHQQQQHTSNFTSQQKLEMLEEANGEIANYFLILYFIIEVFRGEGQLASDLMALDPPLPIYLCNFIAGLREKTAKGYPVKKLLLLTWKSLLACLGGMKDITRVKDYVREIEGLPPGGPTRGIYTKVSPRDFQAFKTEISAKYPTYEPPRIDAPIPQIPFEKIVTAAGPVPIRSSIQSQGLQSADAGPEPAQNLLVMNGPSLLTQQQQQHQAAIQQQAMINQSMYHPQPASQLPPPIQQQFSPVNQTFESQQQQPQSPNNVAHQLQPGAPMQQVNIAGQLMQPQQPMMGPGPIKTKKQQFQTDQSKPFVLPFSLANASSTGKLARVPKSIDEAGMLYKNNMRVSTELWQTWKVREECAHEDLGAQVYPAAKEERGHTRTESSVGKDPVDGMQRRLSALSINSGARRKNSAKQERLPDSLQMLYKLEEVLEAQAGALAKDPDAATANEKSLRQKISDTKRLQRVEIIYRQTLPQMQSVVIVLLKLLLATVSTNPMMGSGTLDNDMPPTLSLENVDIARHREITAKAVSAIIILLLKWFKTSHVMKFHYLSLLLVDSNCVLLILKHYGSQDVPTQVKTKNEIEELNFFKYCNLYGSEHPSSPRPEDVMLSKPANANSKSPILPRSSSASPITAAIEEEPDVITDFSWRNFFSIVNYMHILQKLTKRRAHRILALVQYKSGAILKRILKLNHPLLQLYVLKVLKSQVPFCGRKWRQSNMKVITAIYLNCRPDLRDEWLTGFDADSEAEQATPHDQALRALVKFFNSKHYAEYAPSLIRRSSSHVMGNNGGDDFQHSMSIPLSPSLSLSSPSPFVDGEFFPANRRMSKGFDEQHRASYIPDSLLDGFEDYEEMLGDIFTPEYDENGMPIPLSFGASDDAWHRLGDFVGDSGYISDSESVASIGFLGFGDDAGEGGVEDKDDGRNDWEHLSPDIITALEEERNFPQIDINGSPRPRQRRRSQEPKSPALRPVLTHDYREDESPVQDEYGNEDPLMGMELSSPHSGPAVDEVEAVFGT